MPATPSPSTFATPPSPSSASITQTTSTMEDSNCALVLCTRDAEYFHIAAAAAQNGDAVTKASSRRFVIYHHIGTQTLPPSDGREFKETYGRDPVGREFEYKMGLAALGRYGPETGANARGPGYIVTCSPCSTEKNDLYTDTGFQTKLFQERKMSLVRAKVQATLTANKYRHVAEKAGYHVWTEMDEERIVHSEQFLVNVKFDDNGNAMNQDVNGLAFPNIYGREIRPGSTLTDLVPQQEPRRSGLSFVSAQSHKPQSHISFTELQIHPEPSAFNTLRHSVNGVTSRQLSSRQTSSHYNTQNPESVAFYGRPINTNITKSVILDSIEKNCSIPRETLNLTYASSRNRQYETTSPRCKNWLEERSAAQRPTDFTISEQSNDTQLTLPSRRTVLREAYNEKFEHEERPMQNAREPRGDDGVKNVNTSGKALKCSENETCSLCKYEATLESLKSPYRREITAVKSLIVDHQSSRTKDCGLLLSRKEEVDDFGQRISCARTLVEDQPNRNIDVENVEYDDVRRSKFNHRLTNRKSMHGQGSPETLQYESLYDIARTRDELEHRRELRYKALNGARTQQHAQTPFFNTTESTQHTAKARVDLKDNTKMVEQCSFKCTGVPHVRESDTPRRDYHVVRADYTSNISPQSHQTHLYDENKNHRRGSCTDALGIHGSPQTTSKRSHDKIHREERTQANTNATRKIAEPRTCRTSREEIARYIPRILRQAAQKSAQENDGGGPLMEQKSGDQNRYEDRRKRKKR